MTDATTLLALAERVEKATADDQWPLLREAADLIFGAGDFGKRATFSRFLQAEAFESAAMLLVPEGIGSANGDQWEVYITRPYRGKWIARLASPWNAGRPVKNFKTDDCAAPALALTAACLKARASCDNGSDRNGEDPRSGAEGEASQSGAEGNRPKDSASPKSSSAHTTQVTS